MKIAALFLLLVSLAQAQLINRRAPSFSLPDSRLVQHDILDYRGKWLLIHFMQTNAQMCAKCRQSSARLEAVAKKFAANAALLSIVLPPDDQSTVAKYIQETKITTPVVFDSSQVAIAYFKATPTNNSVSMPHLFVVNPQGTIVREWSVGAMEQPTYVSELEGLLAGGGAKAAPKATPKAK